MLSTDKLEKFKTISQVGNGAFGKCFLCERCSDGEQVVLKKIQLCEDAKREACIISQINHENVVRTFESYISQRSVYIVMEYMSGGTLSELINKKEKRPLKDKIVINYTTQLASALRYIHKDHQIVHRDVKPGNILLDTEHKIVKLCDFGIATKLGAGQKLKGKIGAPGTINYLAPEILEAGEYDFKADIWSLGCVVFEMVEREKAFPGLQDLSVCHKICNRIIVFPEDSKLCSLIKGLLEPKQENRPTAEDVLTLLENSIILNGIKNSGNCLNFWPISKKTIK
ncbi:Protein kinase domain-containing protein [Meloidogyne graminicola]|uniref:non-specific serine/threonine protein kinase n=1 Tax=Meloidogyne graminicola TaxID=189291 RepID=A0A8T0A222_9BILA|nr:Protein kinase domain-containing protein [Meloidogyne graminicola]